MEDRSSVLRLFDEIVRSSEASPAWMGDEAWLELSLTASSINPLPIHSNRIVLLSIDICLFSLVLGKLNW